MLKSSRGAALIDLIVVCGVVAIIGGAVVPTLHATRERDAARSGASYLAKQLNIIRLDALKRNTHVAMRFDPLEPGLMQPFADEDGDGVLQRDIDAGIDRPVSTAIRISDLFESVTMRIARDIPEPEGAGTLTAGDDPVRLGTSNLLSFGPLGSSTSGTIYLAARNGQQLCVRVLGATGRLRVMWFDQAGGAWRQD